MNPVYPQVGTSADLLNSTIRLEALIPFLQDQQASSVALTNRRLYGVLPFYQAVRKAGLNPVIGLTCHIELLDETLVEVQLYAKNNLGYQNLLKISSALEVKGLSALPIKWLRAYREGCLVVVPLAKLETKQTIDSSLNALKEIMGSGLFGGIERAGGLISDNESAFVAKCRERQISLMATHQANYVSSKDAFAYEVAQAIANGVKLSDSNRVKPQHEHHYLPTRDQWIEWFADQPEWLEETSRLLERCRVELVTDQYHMPKFPVPDNVSVQDVLREKCISGLQQRLSLVNEPYKKRLEMELNVINQMGYADYFLIVADFMEYAKNNQILTGPGRGSSASSLVAYSLYITHVDPLEYGLLFERFLNPERITMPDIDIDFADHRRQEVIQYVAKKYGSTHVAQIVTFGTLTAKAAARDVARVFGFDSSVLEMISKQLPNKPGISFEEAVNSSENLKKWIEMDHAHQKWFATVKELEGLPRNASTHAAGVVLSPVPLVELLPIEEGQDGIYLTQWPMKEVEQSGLLKMDFLGLRNLTILERIRTMIWFDQNKWLDFEKIPLNHEGTFKLLQAGDTTGVFQLESDGMRQALRDIRPTHFLDIVAVNALYRPGPMDNIPTYKRRKHMEEKTTYVHPMLEPILKETYGVIVYQEQIMQISSRMAGFTFGESDILRRAVSKKNRQVLDEQRQHFVERAQRNQFTKQEANEVYDLIVRFADYGFPKSHAVAYSLISYQMAYLKVQYPAYFYASLLTAAMGNQEKIMRLIQEVKQHNIQLLPPSIHKSGLTFRVENGAIRFGLSAVKGVSNVFLKDLLIKRKNSHPLWQDIFELAASLSAEQFSRKQVEPLIKAGALDDFGQDRATLLATLDAAVQYAELVRPNSEQDLFDGDITTFGKPKYVKNSDMPDLLKLQFERETLGLYMSNHPVERLKKELQLQVSSIQEIRYARTGQSVAIVGMIEEIRRIRTKKGESMAFITVQDETSDISCTIFPKDYAHHNLVIKEQHVIKIEGMIEWRQGKPQIIVKNLKELS
ncbi:DNA polymerase III subunit alpha [Paenisporosarcina quisquiliarum]|uniref:DNA-directed DNA polymerase n=1 Tax=Paenisporosarcina quisquiliarum TaxID=365346 RepID=A0A9X3LF79_9BACL|nr:DNA polymerase III subunit alpha [Paenisporosarcina quisquiliarum]MCZ8536275.1 DNA polymerase III subunit alpha [Paenisporosarcina quisquiliarum]